MTTLIVCVLCEKHKAQTRLHEEWRHTDRMSPSSRLALQRHPRHAPGCVSDYDTFEMCAL
jgi:hypothetical protein